MLAGRNGPFDLLLHNPVRSLLLLYETYPFSNIQHVYYPTSSISTIQHIHSPLLPLNLLTSDDAGVAIVLAGAERFALTSYSSKGA